MIVLFLIFIFLVLRFTVTLFNFISNPKLPATAHRYSDLVSILIPARNEEENILNLLQSIDAQDYQEYEVIILNDDSTDATLPMCEHFCSNHRKFRVINGARLPNDWIGKNFACHQLALAATGKYFLFLDAGDRVKDGLINAALHRMRVGRLSLLSLFANQEMKTWGERMVVPLMHYLLLNLLPLRLVRLTKTSSFAAASGQFMLFEAKNYREYQWHQEVKNKVVEDVEIMRLIKAYGYYGEALLANDFVSCRMYRSFREALHGFSKNVLAGFGDSIGAILLYLMLVIIGPVAVCFYLDPDLLLFGMTLIVLTRLMISLSSGQNPWLNLLLHPLQMISLVLLAVLSIQNHFTKSTRWKGRKVNS